MGPRRERRPRTSPPTPRQGTRPPRATIPDRAPAPDAENARSRLDRLLVDAGNWDGRQPACLRQSAARFAIAEEAEQAEADQSHRPSRGLGDGGHGGRVVIGQRPGLTAHRYGADIHNKIEHKGLRSNSLEHAQSAGPAKTEVDSSATAAAHKAIFMFPPPRQPATSDGRSIASLKSRGSRGQPKHGLCVFVNCPRNRSRRLVPRSEVREPRDTRR